MAGRGGARPGAGRPKGRRSDATLEREATITELARQYTDVALTALVEVAQAGSDSARVAAANSLLDRGFGKAAASLDVTNSDGSLTPHIIELVAPDLEDEGDGLQADDTRTH